MTVYEGKVSAVSKRGFLNAQQIFNMLYTECIEHPGELPSPWTETLWNANGVEPIQVNYTESVLVLPGPI